MATKARNHKTHKPRSKHTPREKTEAENENENAPLVSENSQPPAGLGETSPQQRTAETLTETEKKDVREAFDILDNDKDGKLSMSELKTLLRGQFVVASNKELQELLDNMDVDKNGTVDYDEFEAFVQRYGLCRANPDDVSEDMRDAFKVFDTDDDGFIDAEEFKTFMTTMGDKMTEEEVQKMMQDADVNGDGKIDYGEFCNFMSKGIY